MSFTGQQFSHSQGAKIGVLITNLGTPTAPTRQALKPYLKQFLSDPRVVEIPRVLWWLILNGVILNIRPGRSAKSYASVWTEQGSPLAIHTAAQAEALSKQLHREAGDRLVVRWAMRYGAPSIDDTLQEMLDAGVRQLLVVPLYPQYSATTTASTFDALAKDLTQRRWIPALRFVNQYFEHPSYIKAVADSIKTYWQQHGQADKLLFSYHGIPLRYLHQGDPYHCQCLKTSRLIAEALNLSADDYLTCFQSRFGREEWLKPYTDKTLEALPKAGVKSVQIICPGFSADCLETIEEIGDENRGYFMAAGGERYDYIPALNASAGHIDFLSQLVLENVGSWLNNLTETPQSIHQRLELVDLCTDNQQEQ